MDPAELANNGTEYTCAAATCTAVSLNALLASAWASAMCVVCLACESAKRTDAFK